MGELTGGITSLKQEESQNEKQGESQNVITQKPTSCASKRKHKGFTKQSADKVCSSVVSIYYYVFLITYQVFILQVIPRL